MAHYDPSKHHRRSIRLRSWDYRTPGAYCVTICTQGHKCLFGHMAGSEMALYDAGRMVYEQWLEIPERFPQVELDLCVVMPNHFHGILLLLDPSLVESRERPTVGAPLVGAHVSRAPTRGAPTLGEVIGAFKSLTTNAYIRGVHEQGWPRFEGRLWQRNFYERVIRNERQLDALRQYILDNPMNWSKDKENPDRKSA